jgi:hypothetical protein
MNDDLGAAVWQNWLHRGHQIVGVSLQRPDAANSVREDGGGRMLLIPHGLATLTRVSHSFKRRLESVATVCGEALE